MKLKKEVREYFLEKEVALEQFKNKMIDTFYKQNSEEKIQTIILLRSTIEQFKRDAFCFHHQYQINGREYLEIKKNIYYMECAIYREINDRYNYLKLDVSIHDFSFFESIAKVNDFANTHLKVSKLLCDFK